MGWTRKTLFFIVDSGLAGDARKISREVSSEDGMWVEERGRWGFECDACEIGCLLVVGIYMSFCIVLAVKFSFL